MNAEQIKALVIEATEEVFKKWNIDAIDKYYVADFVSHNPTRPEVFNLETYKKWVLMLKSTGPQTVMILDDMIAEGNKVVTRWTATRTSEGVFFGVDITGKKVTWSGITITRVADGKIAEDWWSIDQLGFLQQLGIIPLLPGQAAKA